MMQKLTKQDRYKHFIQYFAQHQPSAETELQYANPYQLLVAVILSAQCTDKRVNMVTPALFERYPDPVTLSQATSDEIFEYIKSISYPNNKAKHLAGMAQMLVHQFQNQIPSTIEQLQQLPGVGRKTANVIASVIYNQPAMAVDTHVFRVSKRLGLVPKSLSTPLAVEKALLKHIPSQHVARAHHWLILHGRYICIARKPKCADCQISYFCKTFENKKDIQASE